MGWWSGKIKLNMLGQNPLSAPADKEIVEDFLAAIVEEPTDAEEALKVDEWHNAMKEEIASIEDNKTWSLLNHRRGTGP
jgi:hypothetical protein